MATFDPQFYIDLNIGKVAIQFYPKIIPTTYKAKNSIGYLVKQNAVFCADVSVQAKLTSFGQCTDTRVLIEVIIGQYLTCANEALIDSEKNESGLLPHV